MAFVLRQFLHPEHKCMFDTRATNCAGVQSSWLLSTRIRRIPKADAKLKSVINCDRLKADLHKFKSLFTLALLSQLPPVQ